MREHLVTILKSLGCTSSNFMGTASLAELTEEVLFSIKCTEKWWYSQGKVHTVQFLQDNLKYQGDCFKDLPYVPTTPGGESMRDFDRRRTIAREIREAEFIKLLDEDAKRLSIS